MNEIKCNYFCSSTPKRDSSRGNGGHNIGRPTYMVGDPCCCCSLHCSKCVRAVHAHQILQTISRRRCSILPLCAHTHTHTHTTTKPHTHTHTHTFDIDNSFAAYAAASSSPTDNSTVYDIYIYIYIMCTGFSKCTICTRTYQPHCMINTHNTSTKCTRTHMYKYIDVHFYI